MSDPMNSSQALRTLARSSALAGGNIKGYLQQGWPDIKRITLQISPVNSRLLDVGCYEARKAVVAYLPNSHAQGTAIPLVMREIRQFDCEMELERHLDALLAAFEDWDNRR